MPLTIRYLSNSIFSSEILAKQEGIIVDYGNLTIDYL